MSDLLGIGSSGINAYQRALATVSNNIANATTEGYSRQDVTISANSPRRVGTDYLGTGAVLGGVRRLYDAFVDLNLRSSNSELQAQMPVVTYVNRLIDVMGDQSIGLTTALNQFFKAGRDLATDPASTVQRSNFLRNADALASRFRELDGQFELLDNETRQAVNSNIGKINSLTAQIAQLNKQLTRHSSESEQPAELLDQRDKLLRELSTLTGIKTRFEQNGAVLVSVGDVVSQGVLVQGSRAREIGVASQEVQIRMINGIAAKLAEINKSMGARTTESAQPAELLDERDSLLRSLSFLAEVKTEVAKNGSVTISALTGSESFPLVYGARFGDIGLAPQAMKGDGRLSFVVDPYGDTESLPNLTSGQIGGVLSFREQVLKPAVDALNSIAGVLADEVNASHRNGIDIEGRRGTDLFTVVDNSRGTAAGLQLAITDTSRVAAAGQFRITDSPRNTSLSQATVSWSAPTYTMPSTLAKRLAEGRAPIIATDNFTIGAGAATASLGVVPQGTRDLVLALQLPAAGQTLQVVTRDGRHLLGAPLTSAQRTQIMSSGMEEGATYSDAALTTSSAAAATRNQAAYQGTQLFLGARAAVQSIQQFDTDSGLPIASQPAPAVLQGRVIPAGLTGPIEAGTFILNGVELGRLDQAGALTAQDLADWINATPNVGVTASAVSGALRLERPAGNVTQDIRLGVGPQGDASDLTSLGFDQALHLDGVSTDDLLVFATTTGSTPATITASAQFEALDNDMSQALRLGQIEVKFTSATHYQILNQATRAVLAERDYAPEQSDVQFRGLSIRFSSPPNAGDVFVIDNNEDGIGNNEAMLRMVELEDTRLMPGNLTLTEAYIQKVNDVGNLAQQAKISRDALQVVYEQAVEARDGISGVSLDEEAADLVRFQQAYQANAKVMQVANQLFDAILAVR